MDILRFRRGRCPRSEASTLGVHRPARMTHGLSVDVRRGGVEPRPLAFTFLSFLPPAGYFLSRKKVTKERFKKRGISISPSERALRVRLTIFAKQKSVF